MKDFLKVLMVGSGLSAVKYWEYNYKENGWTVCAINHGYHIMDNWDFLFYADDLHRELDKLPSPPGSMKFNTPGPGSTRPYGGQAECGRGIMLTSSYHMLTKVGFPRMIGYLGADMNYTPDKNGNTCIYGVGYDIKKRNISDPDRIIQYYKFKRDYFTEKFLRFQEIAKCPCYNFSDDPNTRLPFPQVNPYDVDYCP